MHYDNDRTPLQIAATPTAETCWLVSACKRDALRVARLQCIFAHTRYGTSILLPENDVKSIDVSPRIIILLIFSSQSPKGFFPVSSPKATTSSLLGDVLRGIPVVRIRIKESPNWTCSSKPDLNNILLTR